MPQFTKVARMRRGDQDPTASEYIDSGYIAYSRPGGRLYDPIITPILISAAVGAVTAAVTGGNILKGALFGAIGGAVMGAITGAAGGAASGAAGGAAEGAAGAAAGAEGAAAAAADVATVGANAAQGMGTAAAAPSLVEPLAGTSATTGFSSSGMIGQAPLAAAEAAPAAAGAAPAAAAGAPATVSTSLGSAAPTTLAPQVADTSLATLTQGTGLTEPGAGYASSGLSGATPSTSFLDNLLGWGKGMLNNRFAVDAAGRVISGYAAGQNQQALLDWKAKQVQAAQQQARFGATGSRYAPAGMIGPATYH